jgi:putative ABC transport system permease protein
LVSRRLRSLLTLFGIALGVGVLFASLATNAGIEASIDRTVRDIVGRADLRISAFRETGLADETVETVQNVPGIALLAPAVERRTYLGVVPGRVAATLPPPVTVLGIDPATDGRIRDVELVAGSSLVRADERSALITERLAREDGIGLGQEISILGGPAAGPAHVRVVGILAGDGPLVGAAGRAVVVPIDLARETFELDGVSRVDVVLADGADVVAVIAELDTRLTGEPYVLSQPRDVGASLRASTADFRSTTALVAAVALFVGAFLIFNTLSMTVTERVREVGLLRAAGTTRRQVVNLILLEAAALGLAGSAVGLAIGAVLAAGMTAYVRTVAIVPLDGLVVPVDGIALAVGVGLVVTLAAALEPALRASRISPVEALKSRLDPGGGRGARLRWLVAVFAVVGLLGLLAWPSGTGDAGVVRSLAVYGLLLGVTLASPFILGPLGRAAGLPFAPLFRVEERLTRGALVRDRSRTALTVGALTIGLAMIVAVGTVAQSARRAATAWLEGVVPGDEVVTSIRPVALDTGMQKELAAVDGVERVTPVAAFDVAYRGHRLDAAAIVGADFLADGRLTVLDGDRSALAALDKGGSVVVPSALADRLALRAGDTMTFPIGAGRTVDLTVAAVVERGLPGATGESLFVGWPDATTAFGAAGADFFAVRFAPGRAADARGPLETLARSYALEPSPLGRVEGAISDALGRVFGLFDALAIAAVVVAALGIVNTLTMNVRERVREIGVLRAAGMTRPQVRWMVVVEAGILGLVGVVLGGLTGLAAGAVMTALATGGLGSALAIPWSALAVATVLGVGVSMLAASYPARLASRLSIIRAVQYE